MASTSKIKQIDQALGRWYKEKKVDGYFDDNGNGKFFLYCDDNGVDSEGIEDELNDDPENCGVVEFDQETCPTDDPKEVFQVIKYCYHNKDAYAHDDDQKFEKIKATAEFWTLENDKVDIEKTKEMYQTHCKTIFDSGMSHDSGIVRVLAVGRKNDQPYLQLLADMYLRDRITNEKIKELAPAQWAQQQKHLLALKKVKVNELVAEEQPFVVAVSAVDSFFHRICPKLMFNPQSKIYDSLPQTAEYITSCVDFVHRLAQKNESSCPFQWDCSILMNDVKSASNAEFGCLGDDDDEDDDDYDEKDENAFFDVFGDVKKRVKKETSHHVIVDIDNDDDDDAKQNQDAVRTVRAFDEAFNKFRAYQKKKVSDEYPRRHRFCALIDKRKIKNEEEKKYISAKDELIFYDAPKDCNKLPAEKDMVPEWYFDASRTCVIPNIGYDDGKGANVADAYGDDENQMTQLRKQTTTSNTACKNAIVIVSFHVESTNVMRCYLYIGGQVTRFMPNDIIDVLPCFFDESFKGNEGFAKSQHARDMVNHIKDKLRDVRFEAFYKEYK